MTEGQADWRLQGRERYLSGMQLVRRAYRQNAANPTWSHDHCEFCWAAFSLEPKDDELREGYATLDEYRWICVRCFDDFKHAFKWVVASDE